MSETLIRKNEILTGALHRIQEVEERNLGTWHQRSETWNIAQRAFDECEDLPNDSGSDGAQREIHRCPYVFMYSVDDSLNRAVFASEEKARWHLHEIFQVPYDVVVFHSAEALKDGYGDDVFGVLNLTVNVIKIRILLFKIAVR